MILMKNSMIQIEKKIILLTANNTVSHDVVIF